MAILLEVLSTGRQTRFTAEASQVSAGGVTARQPTLCGGDRTFVLFGEDRPPVPTFECLGGGRGGSWPMSAWLSPTGSCDDSDDARQCGKVVRSRDGDVPMLADVAVVAARKSVSDKPSGAWGTHRRDSVNVRIVEERVWRIKLSVACGPGHHSSGLGLPTRDGINLSRTFR